MRTAAARRSPLGYGLLSHGDVDHLAREWVRPVFEDPAVLDDLRRFTVAMDASVTLDAAARLGGFDRPALLAWAADDKLFPIEGARRMQAVLPDARLEVIENSRTFSMLDQPDRLAELVGSVVRVAA
jgi:pimeloyl-ACP methyl ester carboxylesterase